MKFLSYLLLSFLFVGCAHAEGATPQGPGMMSNFIMIGLFVAIFYFMLIRPQTKRQKEHQALVSGVQKDDEVVTTGGMLGTVLKVTEQFVVLSVADGIQVTIQKQAIAASLPKGTLKNI